MAKLKLFWTETAVRQRNYVFEYWNERNKSLQYSKDLRGKISERISLLKFHPNMGRKTDMNSVRMLSIGHYSILYRFDETQIIVVGFWDNRQNPDELLSFLKKSK